MVVGSHWCYCSDDMVLLEKVVVGGVGGGGRKIGLV